MKFILKSLAVFCLVLNAWALAAAEQGTAVAQLTEKLNGMKTLSASFNQQVFDDKGQLLQRAEGEVKLKRPLHFYWRTQQPYEHLLVTDGDILWLYDIDLEQITRKQFTAEVDQAPALLLSGEVEKISQQYTITQQVAEQGVSRFVLVPRKAGSLFRELTISFKSGQLYRMSMLDNFDQHTRIEFASVVVNKTLADEIFRFVPPDGIDVINDEP